MGEMSREQAQKQEDQLAKMLEEQHKIQKAWTKRQNDCYTRLQNNRRIRGPCSGKGKLPEVWNRNWRP